jgi:hypothetical protein
MRPAMKGWNAAVSALLFLTGLLASGCMTLGRPFETKLVTNIAAGKTTRADIERTFGPPYRTGVDTGEEMWTYLQYHLSVFGDQRTTDLVIHFNADGTVKSYAYNTNVPENRLGAPSTSHSGGNKAVPLN